MSLEQKGDDYRRVHRGELVNHDGELGPVGQAFADALPSTPGWGGSGVLLVDLPIPTDEASWNIEHADPEGDTWAFAGGVISHTNPNVDTYLSGFLTTIVGGFLGSGAVFECEARIPSAGQDNTIFPSVTAVVFTTEIDGAGKGHGIVLSAGASFPTPADWTIAAINSGEQSTAVAGPDVALDTWFTLRIEALGPGVVVYVDDVAYTGSSPEGGAGDLDQQIQLASTGLADFRNLSLKVPRAA